MRSKKEILSELGEALKSGVVTADEVSYLVKVKSRSQVEGGDIHDATQKNSVVRSLFYSAGVIMFAAVVSVINQTWKSGLTLHLFLTLVLGSVAWLAAYILSKEKESSEVRLGLGDALALTGSLLLVAGGYILINHFGSYGRVDFFEAALALAVLAVLHFTFYKALRRDLVYLLGMFLVVASIGAVLYGVLIDSNAVLEIWALVLVGLAGLLSWSTHVVSRLSSATKHMQESFDKLTIFVALFTMFLASLGEYAVFWYIGLSASICAVYYLSIVTKQKILLGAASTFLVLMTITIAFRYFSAFGLTASLLISAAGILVVAALATQLSKKYLS